MPRKKKSAPPSPTAEIGTTPAEPAPTGVTSSTPESGSREPVPRESRPFGEPSHAEAVRPAGPRTPNPYGYKQDAVVGVRLLEDRRFRQVQLKFADKPSDAVRAAVADAGFRWRQEEAVWSRQIDPDAGWKTRADAERLFEQVTAMIRDERGLTHEVT